MKSKRAVRIKLAAAFLIALFCSLIGLAGAALADSTISINAPSAGSAIGPGPFTISVSFSTDDSANYMVYAGWSDVSLGAGGESFQQPVAGKSGSVSFNANASGYGSGRYRVTAHIVNADYIPAAPILASTQADFFIDTGAGSPGPITSGIPATDSSSSNGGLIAGIIAGGAILLSAGGLLIRRMMTPVKPKAPAPKPGPKIQYREAETVEEAAARLAASKRNGELLKKYYKDRDLIWKDDKMLDYVDGMKDKVIGKDGQINEANLAKMEGALKYWVNRDVNTPQVPDYTSSDAYLDTVNQASHNIIIRSGMAYLTGGYSEIAMNPIAAVSTMRADINEDMSTLRSVAGGLGESGFSLLLGESGRLVKYAKPYYDAWQKSRAIANFAEVNPDIAHDISTIDQLARPGGTTRDAFMKSTEVVTVGEDAAAELTHAEKLVLELNNNPVARKILAENSDIMPDAVKEAMGVAKQKAYENARNAAIKDVIDQMGQEGIMPKEPIFLQQTGTHARPGNPAWNSLKSDFDHTVDFGDSRLNELYEQRLNTHLGPRALPVRPWMPTSTGQERARTARIAAGR